jgi:hypothetical protein
MATSFATDIGPMFRPIDVEHMKRYGVLLDDFAYMSLAESDHGNARAVLETVVRNRRITNLPMSMRSGSS